MIITQEIFEAFLKCRTKSYLYSNGAVGTPSEFSDWEQHKQQEFRARGWKHITSMLQAGEWYQGTPPLKMIEQRRYRFIFDFAAAATQLRARLHGLELTRSDDAGHHPYMPIRFVPIEKLNTSHRLLLGFDALALSHASGKMPRMGKIIHGHRCTTLSLKLAPEVAKVQSILDSIAAQGTDTTSPPVILNKHCAECEFQLRCRQIAVEKDDLSLLTGLNEKERRKQHDKGIFTVTQLSYNFRPRRRSASAIIRHQPALKALAIRKNQIHIVGTPTLNNSGTPVYFDVEGVPDRDFYYLIGLRIDSVASSDHYSFWANDERDERQMWGAFLQRLGMIEDPQLIHYGSYETQFLKRMQVRYPDMGQREFIDRLRKAALNLLPMIYAKVYFPTYSNGLKEVGGHLGFRWSAIPSSGLAALTWRSQWESSGAASLKQKLITYNAEDCEGLQRVAEAISALCNGAQREGTAISEPVNVDLLKSDHRKLFGTVRFVIPEFQQINQAAYWDYQRNKVYVRSNRRLQRVSRKAIKEQSIAQVRPNKTINEEESRRVPRCNCVVPRIYRWGKFRQTVFDLRWSSTGVTRWVVRFVFSRYICWNCKATFHQYLRKPKYGSGLRAYLLYQNIELQVSHGAVANTVRQLFGLPMSRGIINKVKADEASRYRGTYEAILHRISTGRLVHADETRIRISGQDGYVWVFTNLEEVAFVFSETREARTAQEVLKDFRGVLVSDFYGGYDSIDCLQQKCLVHLMRDINDDLCGEPFNEEMKNLARQFADLVRPMIESVDRFGLKARHLRKHKASVERFYDAISKRGVQTELATGYRKRFEKNRNKLFTFLDYDGVPWNNNNAEHAIKAFAGLRNSLRGASSTRGIKDYLVLLSICETCKYKGVSFLEFLRSEEMDINGFADSLN